MNNIPSVFHLEYFVMLSHLLGRISHALSDVMDQDTLLAYLSHCSSSTIISSGEFDFERKDNALSENGGNEGALVYYQVDDHDEDHEEVMNSV
ncbi:hypothetical protein RHSIM_RhsimUnG0117100 [Rhododendron simsii]|uniref:Uncharacterized protein n=1 Tax=Rhododendron simsii TaxID=118357 RepID=A0A834FX94_RHOSS|nr:hypothetical protein RHSIM_RhsimUnG0117100 [Rhododendron simsii]